MCYTDAIHSLVYILPSNEGLLKTVFGLSCRTYGILGLFVFVIAGMVGIENAAAAPKNIRNAFYGENLAYAAATFTGGDVWDSSYAEEKEVVTVYGGAALGALNLFTTLSEKENGVWTYRAGRWDT